MATVPTSKAVVAFDSRATNFYLTNNSENKTNNFSTEQGVTLSIAKEELSAESGTNEGRPVFEINIKDRWVCASFDPTRDTLALISIGNGMVEAQSRISDDGIYGTNTNVSSFTCNLTKCSSLTIVTSENTIQLFVKD